MKLIKNKNFSVLCLYKQDLLEMKKLINTNIVKKNTKDLKLLTKLMYLIIQ